MSTDESLAKALEAARKVVAAARAQHVDMNMECKHHRLETRCKGCGEDGALQKNYDLCPGEGWWERSMFPDEREMCDFLAAYDRVMEEQR